jgi:hypothetical protein
MSDRQKCVESALILSTISRGVFLGATGQTIASVRSRELHLLKWLVRRGQAATESARAHGSTLYTHVAV